jgi:hypothetical protein
MSRSFVFNELEHILLTEFGDLIIEIARSRRPIWYGEGDPFARFTLLGCGADGFLPTIARPPRTMACCSLIFIPDPVSIYPKLP